MKKYKIAFFSFFVLVCSSFQKPQNKIVKYCDREYIEKTGNVFLKDEMLNAQMVQVIDKTTKKNIFGYFKNAIRNDTNFIYSKIVSKGDTILATTYRQYKITYGLDSSVAKYICTSKGLLFYTYQSYFEGNTKTFTKFNKLLPL